MSMEIPPQPPHWPKTVLRVILPDDPMRDAIFGDLHEEFALDVGQLGVTRARARYLMRAGGIAAFATADFMCWRAWASTSPPYSSVAPAAASSPAPGGTGRWTGGRYADIGFLVLAFVVLVGAIAANMMLFGASRSMPAANGRTASAAVGVVAVLLLLASAVLGAVLLCAGPRWLRRRAKGRVHTA